jgi:hypothetical protein
MTTVDSHETRTKKLPPFGAALIARQQFQHLPFLVFVTAGRNAWPRARRWNQSPNDIIGLVWTGGDPRGYRWPVGRCRVIVEWDIGPTADHITALVGELLRAGARSVTSRPRHIDPEKPAYRYDPDLPAGQRWIQVRETIKTFAGEPDRGSAYAA